MRSLPIAILLAINALAACAQSTPNNKRNATDSGQTVLQPADQAPAKQAPSKADVSITPKLGSPSADSIAAAAAAANAASRSLPTGEFLTGANVAWVHFAADVGTGKPDLKTLSEQFTQIGGVGGKVVRLWLHTNGAVTPEFSGLDVSGPGVKTVADLQAILDTAQTQGVQLLLTLWSFDMLRAEYKTSNPGLVERNRRLLTDPKALALYLDRALNPMIDGVKDHPALFGWDICNEPEGMLAAEGWDIIAPADKVSQVQIQGFINQIAGRIHLRAPKNLVTSGAVSYNYLSPTVGKGNAYTDQALIAAGHDPLGTLDFYEVHHYDSKGKALSPFLHPASYFGADKQVMVGEFYMQEYLEHSVASPKMLYAKLKELGYMGALGWKDEGTPALYLMVNAMTYLQFPGDLGSDPELCNTYHGGYGPPTYVDGTLSRYRTEAAAKTTDKSALCFVE